MGLGVEHISKSFAQFLAVAALSMQVKEGSIFGFLGANGVGKTTTMRMILDIIRPDTGRITWNDAVKPSFSRHTSWSRLRNSVKMSSLSTKGRASYRAMYSRMIIAIFVCALFAARIYRIGILMCGQKPGLGQIVKMVRMK